MRFGRGGAGGVSRWPRRRGVAGAFPSAGPGRAGPGIKRSIDRAGRLSQWAGPIAAMGHAATRIGWPNRGAATRPAPGGRVAACRADSARLAACRADRARLARARRFRTGRSPGAAARGPRAVCPTGRGAPPAGPRRAPPRAAPAAACAACGWSSVPQRALRRAINPTRPSHVFDPKNRNTDPHKARPYADPHKAHPHNGPVRCRGTGAPTAAAWGEDCWTGPPIPPPGSAPSHCSNTLT